MKKCSKKGENEEKSKTKEKNREQEEIASNTEYI